MTKLTPEQRRAADAALKLIARDGWEGLTPDKLAKAAKISLTAAQDFCGDRQAAARHLVAAISHEAQKTSGRPDAGTSLHDRLFENLMARLDVLQRHRPAILSIIAAAKKDPRLGCALLKAQAAAMMDIVARADGTASDRQRQLAAVGLTAIYLATMHSWQKDEGPEMEKTMAFLDRKLRQAGRAANMLFRFI